MAHFCGFATSWVKAADGAHLDVAGLKVAIRAAAIEDAARAVESGGGSIALEDLAAGPFALHDRVAATTTAQAAARVRALAGPCEDRAGGDAALRRLRAKEVRDERTNDG